MKKIAGKLMPIGGGEDKRNTMTVLKSFIEQIESPNPRIEIITIATNMPREVADDYRDAFEDLRVKDFDFIYIEDSREADEKDFLDRIEKADGVFFSGGNQLKLTEVLSGTEFLETLKYRYEKGGLVVAGTSAGAAAMSMFMIAGGSSEEGLLKGEIRLTSGLGFIDGVIIDTHFTERGRYSRLMNIVGTNPRLLGLGFGEDTAAVISDGHIEVIGSGLVVIIDGSKIGFSNITSAKEGDPVTIEGLTVHLLAQGQKFNLNKKKLLVTERPLRKKRIKKIDKQASAKTVKHKRVKHGTRK